MSKPVMKVGDTWLMQHVGNGAIERVRIVSIYQSAVEVERRSMLIGWERPYIVSRDAVVFMERVRDKS